MEMKTKLLSLIIVGIGILGLSIGTVTHAYTSTQNPVDPTTAPESYVINIPDANLKAAMNKLIAETSPVSTRQPTDPILVKDARRVNAGFYGGNTLINKNIENLEGLQYFTNMTTLHLSKNTPKSSNKPPLDITPIKSLKKLINLRLGENHIPQAKFAEVLPHLTNLQELHIEQNQLSDSTILAGLTKLKDLRISAAYNYNVPLTDISPLAALVNLEVLHFNYINAGANALTHFQNLTKLKILQATKAGITTVDPIKHITTLTHLFLNENALTDHAQIANLTNLQELQVNKTGLSNLSWIQNLNQLNLLGIMDNGIADFEPLVSLKQTLKKLYARTTTMDDEDMVHIAQLTNLDTLFVRGNFLSDISALSSLNLVSSEFQNQKKSIVEVTTQLIPNPVKNRDGSIVPVTETADVINVDASGTPDQNGGYIKVNKEGQGTVTVNWKAPVTSGLHQNFSGILTIPYNINLTPPTVTITSPTPITAANATTYPVTGTCSEIGKTVTITI